VEVLFREAPSPGIGTERLKKYLPEPLPAAL
jgi:hypothetical protein